MHKEKECRLTAHLLSQVVHPCEQYRGEDLELEHNRVKSLLLADRGGVVVEMCNQSESLFSRSQSTISLAHLFDLLVVAVYPVKDIIFEDIDNFVVHFKASHQSVVLGLQTPLSNVVLLEGRHKHS